MVSAGSTLNHEQRLLSPAKIEHCTAQRARVRQRLPVDAEHEVARLDPDLRGAASAADARDSERARPARDELKAEKLLGELGDGVFGDRPALL